MNGNTIVYGHFIDAFNKRIFPAKVTIAGNHILSVEETEAGKNTDGRFICPGFIDSHVHIESSLLVPAEFAKMAVVHGTVATVSDPHEIANVCGMEGVNFMLENGRSVPFKFNFGAPSCVPATTFETAGAIISVNDVEALLQRDEIKYLSEMMNFPGVLHKDPEVMKKIESAHRLGKPVDGHAPGLRGEMAKQYIDAGISTDHECFTKEEALDKLQYGMNILIREGSAAKNFEALIDLLHDYPEQIMFCSDDKHPDSLLLGHINQLCARAAEKGIDLFKIIQAACINPVLHYRLDVGLLRNGDPADFIVLRDTNDFEVLETYIDGVLVASGGQSHIVTNPSSFINNFSCKEKLPEDFAIPATSAKTIPVIEVLDGQLITNRLELTPQSENGFYTSDTTNDMLKIAVVNRYSDAPVAVAFIKNFGLKEGALASSVAHDSHNIVAVGVDDASISRAVNLVIAAQGGISAVSANDEKILALPVAGLISNEKGEKVAAEYTAIDLFSKTTLGSTLGSPFMSLSFMALLVIPSLKLSDKGLFDGQQFRFVEGWIPQ